MALAKITTYVADGLARNLQQFKGLPRFEGLLTSFLTEAQAVENALWDIISHRDLSVTGSLAPTGDMLLKLGALVGQVNDYGLGEAALRLFISARIRVNRSDGLRQTMITIARILVPDAPTIYVTDIFPAEFYMEPQGPMISGMSPYVLVAQFLGKAIDAGVRLVFVSTTVARTSTIITGSTNTSGFAGGPPTTEPDVGAGQRMGSVNFAGFAAGPPVISDGGGKLASVVETTTGSTI